MAKISKKPGTYLYSLPPSPITCGPAEKPNIIGSHDLFLGKVVAVQVDEAILNAQGEIDLAKAKPFAYGSHSYWSLGQFVERQGFTASH